MLELWNGLPVWLMTAAFVAGVVDAMAGGGGVITLPALLAAGLPPHAALATNKGQSVFGSATALLRFSRSGLVDGERAPGSFVASLLGAGLGAQLVLWIPPATLRPIVLGLLVGVAIFLAARRGPARGPAVTAPNQRRWLAVCIALVLGTYDGFFGPGTGTFLIVAYALWLDRDLTTASANAKVVNFASNLASVAMFQAHGAIVWRVAIPMAATQLIGAYIGSKLAILRGDRLVRPVVLAVALVLITKLGIDLFG